MEGIRSAEQAKRIQELLEDCLNRIFETNDIDEFTRLVIWVHTNFTLLSDFHYSRIKNKDESYFLY